VTVVGSSWGGLVGLALATSNPARVSRLAVLDIAPASAKAATDVPPRPQAFDSYADAIRWEASRAPLAAPDALEALAAFGYRPGDAGRLVRKSDPFFLERWPFRDEDWWPALPRVTQPTLVARAEAGFLSEEEAMRMVGELHDGRLATIPASGHAIQVDNPRALGDALRAFIALPSAGASR
jgi:pimeloyl-ACP methyl ester carboxylesterase